MCCVEACGAVIFIGLRHGFEALHAVCLSRGASEGGRDSIKGVFAVNGALAVVGGARVERDFSGSFQDLFGPRGGEGAWAAERFLCASAFLCFCGRLQRGLPVRTHRVFLLLLACSLGGPLMSAPLLAGNDPPANSSASASSSAAVPGPDAALAELPKLAPIVLSEPDPGSLQDLDRLLDRLTSDDARTRENAKTAVYEVDSPQMVAAIRHRILEIRTSLDRSAAPLLLEDARRAGKKALKAKSSESKKAAAKPSDKDKKSGAAKESAKDKKANPAAEPPKKAKPAENKNTENTDDSGEGDWLVFMLDSPRSKDRSWRQLVHLLSMVRMLTAIGTTPAVRELIALHAYFGEMLRVDLQRQVQKLRDKAVPALIEARQHDAKIVQRWANKQLDLLGRAIPGEAVGTSDPQILADVLRAYGRTRDVDAVRVLLSFCNSDRIQLREAAREAISAVGEPGIWQLRDAYLNITGNKAPREWTWDRIARELFGGYDRARMAEVYKIMDRGVEFAGQGKHAEAADEFDKVLARAPLFARRKEMVASYIELSKSMPAEQRADALVVLRKALRLDPKGEHAKAIEAEVAYLEGMVLMDKGSVDRFLFTRALELNPAHEGAKQALSSLEQKAVERKSNWQRYAAAAGLGVAALIAMILLGRRPRRPKDEPPPGPGQDAPEGGSAAESPLGAG